MKTLFLVSAGVVLAATGSIAATGEVQTRHHHSVRVRSTYETTTYRTDVYSVAERLVYPEVPLVFTTIQYGNTNWISFFRPADTVPIGL